MCHPNSHIEDANRFITEICGGGGQAFNGYTASRHTSIKFPQWPSAAASFELSTQPYIPYKLSRTKKIHRKIVALEGINYFTPATIYSVPMMLLQQFLHAPSRRLDICFVFFPTPFEYTQLTLHMKPAWRSLPKLYTPWCITLRTRPFSSLLMSYYWVFWIMSVR